VQDQLPQGTVVQGQQARYEVISSVGRGGMGIVYRARRSTDQVVMALKEMRPADVTKPEDLQEFRTLFSQEAELLLRLDHPNIVDAFETFEWNGRPYFVMEFVNGVTLEKRLRDANAPAFEQDALVWTIQMARVLGYLHAQQPPIIYRDLKPGNVILTPDSVIRFIDFGVAREFKAGKAKDTVAIGTYGYAPPEQYGKGQTDAQSDIYTLGATLYHLLTNLGPIPLRTPEPGSIQQHNPSVKPAVEQIVIKAMQQDRARRYRTAQEMEAAMTACLTVAMPTIAAPPTVAPVVPAAPIAPDVTQRTSAPVVPPRARQVPRSQPVVRAPVTTPSPVVGGDPVFCTNCGRANKPGARFCSACGTALAAVASTPAPQPAPSFQPVAPAPQPRSGRFFITTPRRMYEFPLTKLPCRVGRRDPSQNHYPELDLADDDRGHASRRHAVVERRGTQYVLTDVGSVNGTLLNGMKIPAHRPQTLQPGDHVRIGDVEMRFEWA
jgi:eukaryotic-like serine/threonine-protein kinase